jgi:hypothetical protein
MSGSIFAVESQGFVLVRLEITSADMKALVEHLRKEFDDQTIVGLPEMGSRHFFVINTDNVATELGKLRSSIAAFLGYH